MSADKSEEVIAAAADGTTPPAIALMRLALCEGSPANMHGRIEAACALARDPASRERLLQLHKLAASNPDAWCKVRAAAAAVAHDADLPGADAMDDLARQFDAAARLSPEAGVALYSLGSPDLLKAATGEIADWLRSEGLLGPGRDFLDIGCGIGRFEVALARELRSITGVDISAGMVAIARERCRGLANVAIQETGGRDLAGFEDRSFDCVLAIDVFPYMDMAGIAQAHLLECARVLKTGGDLVIMNYSYRLPPCETAAQLRSQALSCGLVMGDDPVRPFRTWDGEVYRLRSCGSGK